MNQLSNTKMSYYFYYNNISHLLDGMCVCPVFPFLYQQLIPKQLLGQICKEKGTVPPASNSLTPLA